MNRESPARAQPLLPKTSPSIHGDSHFSGVWERRFTTLAGAIHTLAGSIHTFVHTFWQGNGSSGEVLTDFAIPTHHGPFCLLLLQFKHSAVPTAATACIHLGCNSPLCHSAAPDTFEDLVLPHRSTHFSFLLKPSNSTRRCRSRIRFVLAQYSGFFGV